MPGQVGRSVPRLESEAKVAGTAEYIHDLVLPGMLHGAIVRSPHPHARLAGIDPAAALEVPGVVMVVTAADVAAVTAAAYYGPAFADQPVLAIGKVRHVGEPVACVLAADPGTARRAAELVAVDYEELPAVFDEIAAARPDAPVLHDRIRASATFTDLKGLADREGTNVNFEYRLRRGDAAAGLAAADRVYDHVFHMPATAHAAMEPMVSVGEAGDRGLVTVHSATQNPSFVQGELARLLGIPENRVRIRTALLGGGFGAKLYAKLEPLAAVCALLARRPVRIALTMEEQFLTITRHAATVRLRTGVTGDGRIVARHCDVTWNTGAYADIGPRVTQKTGFTAAGPYDIDDVSIDSRCVYTNLPPAGALRGFGVPQVSWAYECQSDLIARDLGIDPLDFRDRNVLRNGRPHATGTLLREAATGEVLDELRREMGWGQPLAGGGEGVLRGRGVAIGMKAVITPSTSVAAVSLGGDGSCTLFVSTVDMGQGSDTAFAQIAAESLGLEAEDVTVVHPDTRVTPYDMGTLGSRSLYHMGNAIRQAAAEVRDQLLDIAAGHSGSPRGALDLAGGAVVDAEGGSWPLAELMAIRFGMSAGNLIGRGAFTPPYRKPDPATGQSDDIAAFWMVGGAGAEVSVDAETGALTIDRLLVVGDAGTIVNPAIVSAQLTGAGIMQMGMTRSEELVYDAGQLMNPGLAFYRVPGFLDLPGRIDGIAVEAPPVETGPFGAKGVGETGTFAVSPAIANAIHDAIGKPVLDLPLTDERIWEALHPPGDPGAEG